MSAMDFAPLADIVEAERVKLGAPGVVVVVQIDGKTVFSRSFGDPALKTSTLFRASSIAKVWTAATALRLAADGKLSLDSKVTDVLPGFALDWTPAETNTITLRHLLTHRSGLSDNEPRPTGVEPADDGMLGRWIPSASFQSEYWLMTSPDRTFNYSNTNFIVAGRMLEQVSGKTYREIVREKVWSPLGMDRVLCTPEEILADGDYARGSGTVGPDADVNPVATPSGMGSSCWVSADDLVKLSSFVLSDDPTAHAMKDDLLDDTGQPWVDGLYHGYAYGKGLHSYGGVVVDGEYHPVRVIGHDGSGRGFVSIMETVPEKKMSFVLLTNGNDMWFDESFIAALKIVGLPPAAPMPARGVDLAAYDSLVGTYNEPHELGDVIVRKDDTGKLVVDVPAIGISAKPLNPDHGLRFELRDVRRFPEYYDHYVSFIPDANGKIELIRNRFWIAKRVTS
jgi:CubicO group peptidase (beta-lactamase class C family)